MKTKIISKEEMSRRIVVYTTPAGNICVRFGCAPKQDLSGYLRMQGFAFNDEEGVWKRSTVGRRDPEIIQYLVRQGAFFAVPSTDSVKETIRRGEVYADGLSLRHFIVRESSHSYLMISR